MYQPQRWVCLKSSKHHDALLFAGFVLVRPLLKNTAQTRPGMLASHGRLSLVPTRLSSLAYNANDSQFRPLVAIEPQRPRIYAKPAGWYRASCARHCSCFASYSVSVRRIGSTIHLCFKQRRVTRSGVTVAAEVNFDCFNLLIVFPSQ